MGRSRIRMVLVGKITGQRLNAWLDAHATSRETYAGNTIYSIPSEGRTVRVAQIGYDTIAASNFPTPEKIHSILDRHRTAAWPLSGSTLLEQPLPRCALALARLGRGPNRPSLQPKAAPFTSSASPCPSSPTPPSSPASAGPALCTCASKKLRPLKRRPPARPPTWPRSSPWPAAITPQLGANPANNSFKELLETAAVTQHGERVVVTATVPGNFFSGL